MTTFTNHEIDALVASQVKEYDQITVAFSGGKDSQAAVLRLFDLGVPAQKIVLLHHDVDGEESDLMDWPITKDYCRAFAEHFGLRLYYSWKVGGFEGEMLRENALTQPVKFESSLGEIIQIGGTTGKENTRLKFPQLAADLRTRWCSAYLKIDVGGKVLTHDPMFKTGKHLFITGERAQESSARAKYKIFEPHAQDRRLGKKVQRYIDHWRNVITWEESEVWEIIERYKVVPHPAYWLGWGRTSCLACIFGSANQWATIRKFMPDHFKRIADYEAQFGVTIHRTLTVNELADKGTPYTCCPVWLKIAMHRVWDLPIVTENWKLPSGAFGECNGPT